MKIQSVLNYFYNLQYVAGRRLTDDPILSLIDNSLKVSNSEDEPNEMYRKRINSFVDCLVDPSLMLVGSDTAALHNWEVSPNFYSLVKSVVNLYTSTTNFTLCLYTSKSL